MFIRRRQYFIDRAVQGGLVVRTATQWSFCLLSIAIMLLCWRTATHPKETFVDHLGQVWNAAGPAFIGGLLLLPIVVFDVVKMSNRFVGPVYRIRNAMQKVAAGENVRPVRFRDGDMWQDLATDFNAVLARLAKAEGVSAATLAEEFGFSSTSPAELEALAESVAPEEAAPAEVAELVTESDFELRDGFVPAADAATDEPLADEFLALANELAEDVRLPESLAEATAEATASSDDSSLA